MSKELILIIMFFMHNHLQHYKNAFTLGMSFLGRVEKYQNVYHKQKTAFILRLFVFVQHWTKELELCQ